MGRRYARGHHRLDGGAHVVVSHGVGMSDIPVRLFARPQVHLLTITTCASAGALPC
jgi:predicted MPP superfamily phosphohydrolase